MMDPTTLSIWIFEYAHQVRNLGSARRRQALENYLTKFQAFYETEHPGRSFLESLDRTRWLAGWVNLSGFRCLAECSRRIRLNYLRGFTEWLFSSHRIDSNAWFYVPFRPAVDGSVPDLVLRRNLQREIADFGTVLQGQPNRHIWLQAAHQFNLHWNRFEAESEEEHLLLWLAAAIRQARSQLQARYWVSGLTRFLDYRVSCGYAERNVLRELLAPQVSCRSMVRRLAEVLPNLKNADEIRQKLKSIERPPFLQSPMAGYFEALIQHESSRHRRLGTLRCHLGRLDRVLHGREATSSEAIEHEALEEFLAKGDPEPRTYNGRLQFLRKLHRFLSRRRIKMPSPDRFWHKRPDPNFRPHIYTLKQVGEILKAIRSRGARSRSVFRWRALETIVYLLYACGLRLSEPLGLRIRDVDLEGQILLVARTKFYKQRWVPISPAAVRLLREYVICRDRTYGPVTDFDAPFFLSSRGNRISKPSVLPALREAVLSLGIRGQGSRPWPCLHDFRHSFAVHKLYQWYSEGRNVQNKLPLLSTYLGHLHYRHTEVYLHLTEDLMRQAGKNFQLSFEQVVGPWVSKC